MHQRERGHLPALSQTPTNDAPEFFKSAPNLDKSRINHLAQQTNDSSTKASTSHNNMLGKSVDGLNIIRSNKNKNKTITNANSTTKLDSDNHLDDNLLEDFAKNNNYKKGTNGIIYDTDDEEGLMGCFNFISRNDNNESYSKRKKHSLDSKMEAHVPLPQNSLHLTVQKFGSSAYGQEVQVTDEKIIDNTMPNVSNRNLDDVPYDRIFFRKLQKSLDDIFSGDDINEQFASQKSRNSKSSGDLTMYSATDNDSTYEQYRFGHRFGSSKSQFRRECFLVDQNFVDNDDDNNYKQNGNEMVSFDTGTNNEYHEKNTDSRELTELSNGESHFREDHSQLINVNNMNVTPTASRKSSVTFRNSNDNNNLPLPPLLPPCTSTSNEIFYENIDRINMNSMVEHSFVSNSTTDSIFLKEKPTKQGGQRFEIISHPHTYTNATNLIDAKSKITNEDKMNKTKNSKHRNMFNPKQILSMLNPKSFSKKSSVLSSNSFYTKFDGKTEMNEQLLDDDDANAAQCNSNTTNGNDDPKYDSIYRTKNFLLAKQHDN